MKRVLVIGSSGSQGGEVMKELLKRNKYKLRALMRKESAFSEDLKSKEVEIVLGNLNDEKSLEKAMEDVYGVFSVLAADYSDPELEIKQERNIVEASEKQTVSDYSVSYIPPFRRILFRPAQKNPPSDQYPA